MSHISKISVFLAALFTLLLAGCTSSAKKTQVECTQKDWYELGRNDGAQGSTLDRLALHKKTCVKVFTPFLETMYINGRNAGLVEYCAPENSYELGRMGIAYHYVCPSTMEIKFLAGYRKGQKARELEIANQKIDAEIDALLARMNNTGSGFEKRQIASELNDLRKARAKNERDLVKIDN